MAVTTHFMPATHQRRLSAGAEILPDGTTHVRVWAPGRSLVEVVRADTTAGAERAWRLSREPDGYHSGDADGLTAGDRYWLRLDGELLRPDPASRCQPDGPHGPSMVVDARAFQWTDGTWRGIGPEGQVIYEMHVGTFTREGTFRAAAAELAYLAELGITVIEMMPVADFAGSFGWGYDGVDLYAPSRLYGTPDDLRAFVDAAHALGLGVILDVVYNHVGPDGNYLEDFSREYFTDKYKNDWGRAINFEGPAGARNFFVENAAYWIDEFHFDGLRLDATQDMHDASPEHAIAAMVRAVRAAAGERRVFIVGENEPQDTRLVRTADAGGYGLDALWNDDFHHAAVVALTGKREAYYTDYKGSPQEFISCAKYGYLYQGQWYEWQKKRRGTPALDLPPHAFVAYLENHDQVANTAFGHRLLRSAPPGRLRALTALLLLGPATPMLFQGQEFGASSPFLYFADHKEELRGPIAEGRREFLSQFPSLTDPEVIALLASPGDRETYLRSKIDLSERHRHAAVYALHRDLLWLRRQDAVLQRASRRRHDGAVIAAEAFVLRYQGQEDGDRLLVVNLGCDMDLAPIPEPLLAPPAGSRWTLQWSSESPRYEGAGTAPIRPHSRVHVAGESAILLKSVPGPIAEDEDRAEELPAGGGRSA
jgi:maltooligosyltrehalose trehalohydrolase